MEMKLERVNPNIRFSRYETPSAIRKAGAFLPRKLMDMRLYEYRLSPYMGCEKRCRYCFELHNEFIEKDEVKIKTNTVSLVKKTVPDLSGNSAILVDGYDSEQAESRERLIRRSLETIVERGLPVIIQTKSDLVLRDMDLLLESKAKGTFVKVFFSLTSLSEEIHRTFEPYTCPPRDRIRAMGKLSDAGIPTDAILMPILPYISDTEEELDRLFSTVKGKGCGHMIPGPLRLTSSGPQRDAFLEVIKEYSPSLLGRYEKLYPARGHGWKFGTGPQSVDYMNDLNKRIGILSRRYNIPTMFERPALGRFDVKTSSQSDLGDFF